MGKKNGEANPSSEQKEGYNLLGSPSFEPLENGRFKCMETGHELPAHSTDSYAQSKHCRLGLIDSAIARNKPPLNMFSQDPASRSKLICKLTGVTINKSEEHIWKHVNGKRFLNTLEQKEAERELLNGTKETHDKENEEKKKKKKKKNGDGELKKKKKKTTELEDSVNEISPEVRDSIGKESDSGEDVDFWIPSVGNRWDHDDGGDRWASGSESDSSEDAAKAVDKEANNEAGELSKRTKRMSLEIGPSSFASRKKKKKLSAT